MAEYGHVDASIPLSVRKPDSMGKLSELLNMQRQSIAVQADKTALASAQQSQRQREGLASFDWSKLVGDDGTIDLNKIMDSGLREAAGDQFPQALSQATQIKQQQLAAKQTLVGLTDLQRKSFAEMVGALRSDPDVVKGTPEGKQKLNDALGQYVTMYGPDVENVVKAYAAPLMKAPAGKAGQILQNIQLQATSASDQASRQAPQYQSTGSELRNVNPYAQTAQAPGSIPLTIAPGQQSQVGQDPIGNPMEVRRDARGNIIGATPLAGMPTFGPGERQSLEQQAESNFRNVEANRIAASLAPQQLDQISKALKISEGVSTGGGGDFARKRASFESAISAVLPGFDTAVDDATKLQMLDKYLERIAADSARVLGANASTDAARESIARQNASTGYTRDAVQSVLEYAKAQTMAMEAKGNAQEHWLKDNKITNQHEFETKWRQAYDPLLFQLEALPEAKQKKLTEGLSAEQKATLRTKLKSLRELGAMK
jgi:hypothetical protein